MTTRTGLIACVIMLIMFSAGTSLAAHPLVSDDAGALGKGAVQVELNGDISTDKETSNNSTTKTSGAQMATTLGVGVTDKLDLSFGIARPWSSGNIDGTSFNNAGSIDFNFAVKWQIYEHEGFGIAVKPQLGYSSAVNVPEDDHTVSYGAALIFSREFEPFAVHLNAGYTYNDHNLTAARDASRSSIWNFSLAATCEIIKHLKLATDFGVATNEDKAVNDMPVFGLIGAMYSINRNVDLSGGVKVGLTKPETDLSGTFGVTVKF